MNKPSTTPAPESGGPQCSIMNGKPVLHRDAKTVLKLDAEAFKRLVRAAVDLNRSARHAKAARGK